MFTVGERVAVRDALLARARSDRAVIAAAIIGSAAAGTEDAWSDIDLALKIAPNGNADAVYRVWTQTMYAEHAAVHHVDMWAYGVRFRVFLLDNTLQVDLSFWTGDRFLVTGSKFELAFGDVSTSELIPASPSSPASLTGMGWLYALHARSAIERGRTWQAIYMLDGMRDQVIALTCIRAGLPPHEGRGVDRLPQQFLDALASTRAREADTDELRRALIATTAMFLDQVTTGDAELAAKLRDPIRSLTSNR